MIGVYARVSSARQAENHGTESQEHAIAQWAAQRGNPELRWFREEGGQSGRKANRKAFMALVAAVKAGEVTEVVTYSLSRLARSVRVFSEYLQATLEAGVRTTFASDGMTIDPKNPMSKAMAQIVAVMAEWEADTKREASSCGIQARLARGERWGGGRVVERGRRGCRALTDAQVAEVRARRGRGEASRAVAESMGVSERTIERIVARVIVRPARPSGGG